MTCCLAGATFDALNWWLAQLWRHTWAAMTTAASCLVLMLWTVILGTSARAHKTIYRCRKLCQPNFGAGIGAHADLLTTAVVMAAQVCCHNWANHHIFIHKDNQVTEAVIYNGTARNNTCLDLLKHLASLALEFNFTVCALCLSGIDDNVR